MEAVRQQPKQITKSLENCLKLKEPLSISIQQFYTFTLKQLPETILASSQSQTFILVKLEPNVTIHRFQKENSQYTKVSTLIQSRMGLDLMQRVCKRVAEEKSVNNLKFTQISNIALKQEAKNIPDLTVGDIYGPDSSLIGLPPSLLASSLGKLNSESTEKYTLAQIFRSLILAFSVGVAQLIALNPNMEKNGTLVFECLSDNQMKICLCIQAILGIYGFKGEILYRKK